MYEVNGICYAGAPVEGMKIKAAQVLTGGIMLVEFSTGEKRLFDTTQLKGSAFQPLQDEAILRNFELFHGVLTWQDGEIDIAPETVYAESFRYDEAI